MYRAPAGLGIETLQQSYDFGPRILFPSFLGQESCLVSSSSKFEDYYECSQRGGALCHKTATNTSRGGPFSFPEVKRTRLKFDVDILNSWLSLTLMPLLVVQAQLLSREISPQTR